MSRYAEQTWIFLAIIAFALATWIFINFILWKTLMKRGMSIARVQATTPKLAILFPASLALFNVIVRAIEEPHSTVLWAYIICPVLISLPFIGTIIAINLAKKTARRG